MVILSYVSMRAPSESSANATVAQLDGRRTACIRLTITPPHTHGLKGLRKSKKHPPCWRLTVALVVKQRYASLIGHRRGDADTCGRVCLLPRVCGLGASRELPALSLCPLSAYFILLPLLVLICGPLSAAAAGKKNSWLQQMSGSLAGGLLPLGKRGTSGSEGSKSALTGGLIPLTSRHTKPTASSEPLEEGSSGGWDQQKQGSERGGEEVSDGSRSEKKVDSALPAITGDLRSHGSSPQCIVARRGRYISRSCSQQGRASLIQLRRSTVLAAPQAILSARPSHSLPRICPQRCIAISLNKPRFRPRNFCSKLFVSRRNSSTHLAYA